MTTGRRRVGLADHDPSWGARFEEERRRILDAAGEGVVAVEHIGSTAVPGMPAKPVLDLLVGLPAWPAPGRTIRAIEGLGYGHRGEAGVVGRHWFVDGPFGGHRTRHLHAVGFGTRFWHDHLRFRDWLRTHPEDAAAYARLKGELAARHPDDAGAYTDAKTPFVRDVLRRARAEDDAGGVHEAAARGFDHAAETYEAARPGYADAAVDHLARVLDLRVGRRVVDVGAGTGKLTGQLVPTGARVIAVEPVPGMRAVLARNLPDVAVVDAAAEELPLPRAAVDAVVAGQAFHWFEPYAALSEFRRVLVEDGGVGLLWNVRDRSVRWVAAWTEIADRAARGTPREHQRAWEPVLAATRVFHDRRVARFPNPHRVDRETLVARFASTSGVAAAEPARREALLAEFRAVLDAHPETRGGVVTVPYETEVHTFRVAPRPARDTVAGPP